MMQLIKNINPKINPKVLSEKNKIELYQIGLSIAGIFIQIHKWRKKNKFYEQFCKETANAPDFNIEPYNAFMKNVIADLNKIIKTEKPDLYISHLLRMVPFLENAKLQEKSIVEMTDALSKTYALATGAKGNTLLQNIYKIEKHLIAKYERFVVRHYPKVVLVSQSDIDFLSSHMEEEHTESLKLHANGVEYLSEVANHTDTKKICFIGHMQSLQNQDAVIHFVNDIFPLILAKKPDMKFYVVGAHPPKSILKLDNGKNIFVTGFVDDLNKFVADSCIAVAPVQIAAGIQNKVLVAMANAIPVVLTPLIAKAIPELRDGENCFIRDDDLSFAEACLSLLEDINLRAKIREQGRHTVIEHYSWHSKLYGYELFDKH
jgi:glycosyltransferase involved in cell wall biosynthesis